MADYDDPEGNATHAGAGTGDGRSPPSKRTDGRCPQDDPTGVQIIIKNEIFGRPVCSPSRGLFDLVTHVNEPMTVYTRKCSVSLPLGLGILSKPAADSSPIDVEGLVGQELLEIFEVSANFHFVGTILVCDTYSCKTIYEINNWDQTYYDFTSRRNKWVLSGNAAAKFKDKLALTGPSRATTANSGFVIKVYIPATRKKDVEICKLSCHTGDESLYNQLRTHTIKTSRGRLYVTCAVLPDALDGFVKVLLRLPSSWRGVAGATIYGLITARIERFDIESTLFIKDFKEAVALEEVSPLRIKEGYIRVRVPLMRTSLVAPIGEYIHVKGKVHVCGYDDNMPITIDHRILIDCEEVRTPWIKGGESLSAVRMWLRPIF
ncbi:hypothetical protein ACQ4PT_021258 [Festuca glaucescens]